jgi:Leucine-rich repeat (LRR) protein
VIEPLPPTLTHLGLSGNFLPDLPASISDLVNLRELYVPFLELFSSSFALV